MTSKLLEKEIVKWNYNFPLDRWWRKKYGVPFNSKKHQKISQIDILFEYFEEKFFDEVEEKVKKHQKDESDTQTLSKEDEDLFDKIKF